MLLNIKQQQSRRMLAAFTSLTATLTLAASLVTLYPVTPAQATLGPGGTRYAHENNVTLDIEDEQPFTYNSTSALYTTTANLHVTATKPYGFNLTMQATSNALTNTLNSSHQIPSLTTNNQALGTNQWGYTLTNPDTLSHSSRFNPIPTASTTPTTATILDVAPANPTDSSNTNPCNSLTNCTTKVLYAANLNPATLPTGTYQTTITYTVTAKPAPKPVDWPRRTAKIDPSEVCRSGDNSSSCLVNLDRNMIPVKYTGTTTNAQWTSLAKPEDKGAKGNWYDYGKKQWANAITVKKDALVKYQGKDKVVDKADILGFWVYVPRYAYEVMRRDGTDKPVKEQNFDIKFENIKTPKKRPLACKTGNGKDYRTECGVSRELPLTGGEVSTWSTHPAFSFGKKELNGIWFGKFETTGTAKQPTVLPNEAHISGYYVDYNDDSDYGNESGHLGALYSMAKSFGVDDPQNVGGNNVISPQNSHHLARLSSHMVNNNDWGAATYLSASKYGAGYNGVQINANGTEHNNISFGTTGCGPYANGDTGSYSANTTESYITYKNISTGSLGTQQACSSDGTRAYNGTLGQLASTTNNPTGIYDMAGGGWEFAAASYTSDLNNSSTDDEYFSKSAHPPYVNNYNFTEPNDCTFDTCGGQALYETNNGHSDSGTQWNGNYSYFVCSSFDWFRRGGYYGYGLRAGLFYANNISAYVDDTDAFRVALTPPLQN